MTCEICLALHTTHEDNKRSSHIDWPTAEHVYYAFVCLTANHWQLLLRCRTLRHARDR